ncbi:MAG: GerMN domain-containing protein [Lachnospiraceae bacterium]|jgi:Spore germination protein|nr:GerMN domain-containing protein [Lachnospiraceae bacterium]
MKIRAFWFTCLLAAGFILCTGCQKNSDEDYKGYYIFGLDANETKVAYEKYTPVSKNTEELVEEFLNKMSDKPEDVYMKNAVPDDVTIDNYVISEEGSLSIYFNSSYGNYTGVPEILRRAAIVKTLCQVPGVEDVQFYVAGQPLTTSNMEAVGIMTASQFIDNTGGETSYKQNATLNMYFSDYKGTALVEVPVEITYDATIPLEQLAIEQLMKGPYSIEGINKKSVLPTIPAGTRLNNVTIKENTCYVDFSSDFLNKRKSVTSDVAIYSVVNTLVELPAINKVQFSIDGGQVLEYSDSVGFGEPFERNLDLVVSRVSVME